jgi:precorrin-2 dehydrogenase/sirohydrochlorin ferrochelatase
VAFTYPLVLDVSDRPTVIVGGGKVGARKARGLIDAGAKRVRCVSLEFCAEMPAEVERIGEQYHARHLDGAAIVFAATDRADVNEAVVRDAAARHLLVSRADRDDEEPGDFIVPAKLQRGGVSIAVSAGSPALSALIRDRLQTLFDPRWEQMAEAMASLRPLIKSARIDIAGRSRIFRELASEEALNVLADGGLPGLRAWLADRHPELTHA